MNSGSADRFRRADAIFDAALDLPDGEQAGFVDQACGDDFELRGEVHRLLQAHRYSDGFLGSPALDLAVPLLQDTELGPTGPWPERIGPFRIVSELGHGGMGTVYLGERDDGQFEQRAALKLIRRIEEGQGTVRRFLEERRILALLEHPRIARLLDGGISAEGQPYFAMELVEGEPIDRFCDARGLTVEGRLELFLAVCDAVQYAHQHLVVHRDLKPSNILVTGDGQIKLLDFGIAKLLDPLATPGAEPVTRTGVLPMTPEYAAPEQVRGDPVSTATDVYALGVLLYLLLTGRRPYEVRGRPPAEVQQVICELDPPRPSATYAGNGKAGADSTGRAGRRGGTAERLRRQLRGDLDVIVLKALRKEPAERYTSVQALAEDIRRHRSGHPVLARPQTAGYRARRFVRRHRIGLAAAAAIGILLLGYAITLRVQQGRIQRALVEARLGTRRAEQVTDFMLGLFEAAEGGKALTDTVTARELLSRGVTQARELAAQPEMQAQMFDVIGRLYLQLGEYDRALPLIEEGLTLRRSIHGEEHADVATSLANLAAAFDLKQDIARALDLRRQALALRRRVSGNEDPRTLDALWFLSQALHRAGEDSAATPRFEEWLSLVRDQPQEISASRAEQLRAAGALLMYRGQPQRAEPLYREAIAVRRELYGGRHHLVASSLSDLAVLLYQTDRVAEAEPLIREAVTVLRSTYPDGHPELAADLRQWGNALQRLGRFADAQQALREAVALRRRFGGENIDLAMTELDLAIALTRGGASDDAVTTARDGIRILRQELGEGSAMVSFGGIVLGDALRGQGNYVEAERLLLTAYQRFATPRPVTTAWRGYALGALVRLYEAQGRSAEATRYRSLLEMPSSPSAGADRP